MTHLKTLRIEAGVPRFGVDMDETNVVTETGLDDAVSFTKGCYIGQEIIARIKYRGHVAKRLSGLRFEGNVRRRGGRNVSNQTTAKRLDESLRAAYSPQLDTRLRLVI